MGGTGLMYNLMTVSGTQTTFSKLNTNYDNVSLFYLIFYFLFCNPLESISNPRTERIQRGAPHLLHLRLGGVDVVVQSVEGDLRLLRLSALPLKLLFTLKNNIVRKRMRAPRRGEKNITFLFCFFNFEFYVVIS